MTEEQYSKTPIRVLWIAQSCSLQDDCENPGLTGRMEQLFSRYCPGMVELAIAYMADGSHEAISTNNGISYYAVNADLRVGITEENWGTAKAELLRVIGEFQPDVIQCFGAEWPYGLIAENVKIPVVIHMMGFLNIYYLSIHMAQSQGRPGWISRIGAAARRLIRGSVPMENAEARSLKTELRVMRANRFFFGRTNWDRNIVRYYSPDARYFYMPEMIKPALYDAAGQWEYHAGRRLRLFTLSSADDRKGNEIILRTAKILKEVIGLDYEWRVAGEKESFARFQKETGIDHLDVNIELIGMIGCAQIIEEFKAADLFIHPSIMDNSPHAVCEAQLMGCPVIASNVGGLPDLVKEGETGFLYPYNEPHTLAFLIANLYRDRELLTTVSKKEVSVSHEHHDPEKIAKYLLQAYQAIIEEAQYG